MILLFIGSTLPMAMLFLLEGVPDLTWNRDMFVLPDRLTKCDGCSLTSAIG